jgi:putative protease
MKILSPLDKVEEVEELIKAGADELYCGVLSEEWLQKYPVAAVSRRAAKIANLKSFADLKSCAEIAHFHNIPLCLSVNEHYYTQEQYSLLSDYVEQAVSAGVDSFLISDLSLLLTLNQMGVDIPIHISVGGTTFNSETAKFYQDLGASRVTFDRQLTISEIKEIVKNTSNIETCVFILNCRCANVDGLCTFIHVDSPDPSYKSACMLPYPVNLLSSELPEDNLCAAEKRVVSCVRQQVWTRLHIDDVPCGACALYDFEEMGIGYAKIVGRGNPTQRKVYDLAFVHSLLELLKNRRLSKREFREKARRLYRYVYRLPCRTIMCYYPEVMMDE